MEVLINKRIRLVGTMDDNNPIPVGSEGIIIHIGGGVINVKWDNGRTLGLIEGEDQYIILDDDSQD
jgi:hypothetical protein